MASGGNRIDFTVGYTVDKAGLNDLQSSLKNVVNEADKAQLGGNITGELEQARQAALDLSKALSESWNNKLNQLDLSKFDEQMTSAGYTAEKLKQTMESSGSVGANAYNQISSSILSTNLELKETNKFLDNMATTMSNTVKWNVSSRAMNALVGAIQSAWSFTKELDTSLNNIRIVTEKSAEDMAAFAESANTAAKSLGASTTDYTNASLIYYQQGLSDEEVAARTDVTLKAANVTKQSAKEVSEQLTSVWNGYQVTAQEAESSIDVLAAVAANTASNLEELSTGMSKVASAANTMGVSEEQLAAQLSTIISATRQAPESTGQALKTIYARMSTISAGGTDEDDGATLTSYTAKMDKFGISVLDANGHLREMGDVIEEIGGKWDDFSREQQISLAQIMAGTRQYNNLLALFNNWDKYTETLEIAEDATGTLQSQQDIYMESTEAHLQQLSTTAEDTYTTLFDTDAINTLLDGLTSLLDVLNSFLSSLGGGLNTLAMLGVMGVNVFSNQIGKSIEGVITKQKQAKANQEALKDVKYMADMGMSNIQGDSLEAENSKIYKEQEETQKRILNLVGQIDSEEYNKLTNLNSELTALKLVEAGYINTNNELLDGKINQEEINSQLKETDIQLNEQLTLHQSLVKFKEKLTEITKQEGDHQKEIEELLRQEKTVVEALNNTRDNGLLTDEQKVVIEDACIRLLNNEGSAEENIATIIDTQNIALQRARAERSQIAKIQEVIQKYDATDEKQLRRIIAEIEEILEKGGQIKNVRVGGIGNQEDAKKIADITRGISALAMGISTVVNTVKILKNNDLSPYEKLEQIASNLLFTVPMLITTFKGLKINLESIKAAADKAAAAFVKLQTAMNVSNFEIGIIIAAIAAAIIAIAVAVNQAEKAYNSASIEADKAAESAERLADMNDKIAESVSNLQSMIDAYKEAKNELDECTDSTEDWKDALNESNQAAIDLVDSISAIDLKNAGLDSIQDLYDNQNGIMVINEDNLKKVTEAADKLDRSSKLASAYADYNAEMAKGASDLVNAIRTISPNGPISTESTGYTIDERQWVDTISENLDSINSVVGDVEVFGDKLTSLGLNISGLSKNDLENLRTSLGDLELASDAAAEKLNLIGKTEITEILSGENLDEGEVAVILNVINSQQKDTRELLEKLFNGQQLTEDEKNAIGYTGSAVSFGAFSDETNQQVAYILDQLREIGYNYEAATDVVTGSGANRELHFKDASTGEELEGIKLSDIEDIIAEAKAYGQLGNTIADSSDTINEATNNFSQFKNKLEDENGSGFVDALNGWLDTKNFDTSTLFGDLNETDLFSGWARDNFASRISKYFEQIVIDGIDGIDKPDEADDFLNEIFGTEDWAEQIGKSGKEYCAQFKEVSSHFTSTINEELENLNKNNLSISSKSTIGNILQDTLTDFSKGTMLQMSNVFQTLDQSGDLDNFINGLSTLDDYWGSVSYSQFIDAMEQAGVSTDISQEALYNFCGVMNEVGQISFDSMSALEESFSAVYDIVDKLDEQSTVTAKEYETLSENLGIDISSYFTEMLEGTYKLTAGAEDFKNAVKDFYTGQLKKLTEESQGKIDNAQYLQNNVDTSGTLSKLAADVNNGSNTTNYILNAIDNYQQLMDITGEAREEFLKLQEVEAGNFTKEQIEQLQEYCAEIEKTAEETDNFSQIIKEQNADILAAELAYAESCQNLTELKEAFEDGTIQAQAFNTAYLDLREAERMEGLDSDELSDYAKYLQKIADQTDDLADSLKDDDQAAKNLAIQIENMSKGIQSLSDNIDDWSKALDDNSKTSDGYSQALDGIKTALSEILDIDKDFINDKFVVDHMNEIKEAAKGDTEAIEELRAASLDEIIIQIALNHDTVTQEALSAEVDNIQSMIDDIYGPEIEVGAELDDQDFIDACNEMIAKVGMTVPEVEAMFDGMDFSATVEVDNSIPQTQNVPVYKTSAIVDTEYKEVTTGFDDFSGQPIKTTMEIPTITYWTEQTDTVPVEGNASAVAMDTTTDGSVGTPKITKLTKKAPPSYASKPTKKSSGGGGKGSGGGSKGSGGGSKGKSNKSNTKSEPKKVDNIEDEADRYHDVNIRLKEISTTLSRLQKQEDKLFGAALIDNLNERLSTLNDQWDATNDKLSIANQESKEMQKELSKNYGIKFDANGDISNYGEVYAKEWAKVNKVIDKYNSKSAKGQEKYQEKYDAALKEWDDFLQGISDYDDLQENISGLKDDLTDINDAMTQLRIQKFTMEIEIRLDMSQAERDWNKFYRKVILGIDSDDIMGNAVQNLADIVSYYSTGTVDTAINGSLDDWLTSIDSALNSGGTGSIQTLTDQIYDTLDQLAQIDKKGSSSVYGEDKQQALDDLQTYYEELMSGLEDVYDLVKAIEDSYLDMIDEAIDAFDEQVNQYEYINDLLNHDINLVSLIYGDDAYETMNKYYEQIEANNNEELDFLRKRVDYAAAMMEAETDDEARKKWEEEWENALSDLNDKVEDSVQNIIDKYTNVINQIISEMNDAITGGLGLDYVGEEWDLLNQDAEIYLDTINRLYSLQDLQNKWQTSIDETDDIAAQRTLSELMEQQLEYLEEKGELTQHDIERAELEYEIALKQIALEEAQRNKSTMRLRRDANGNYTYQYVSDTSEVEAAQQELAELQNQLYNLDVDAYQENLDQIYSIYKDFEEKIAEVYEDQTLSEQERDQQIALYTEQYSSMLDKYLTENSYLRANLEDSAFKSLAALSDAELDALEALSDEEKNELMSSLIPQWDSSVQHMVDTFNENGGLMSTCQDFLDALDQALDDYESSLSEMADSAGVSLNDLASGYDATTESVQKLIENNDDLIDSWSDQVDAMEAIVKKAEEIKDSFDADTESAKKAAEAAKDYIETTNEAAAQAAHDDDAASDGNSGNDGSGGDNGKNTQGDGKVQVGDKVEFIKGVYHNLPSGGKTGDEHKGTGKKLYVTKKKSGADYPIRLSTTDEPENENKYKLGWVKKKQISGYDTGGYTGDWDDEEGRLGVLHKKEMVLNKADTVNLLNAVGIVRDVATMLNNLNTSMFSKMSSLKTGSIKNKIKEHKDKVLKQDVHIEANFPNVRDSAEIEQAFNNLVNVASQHAYNTQR